MVGMMTRAFHGASSKILIGIVTERKEFDLITTVINSAADSSELLSL